MALEIVADICEFVFVYFIINCFREIKNGDHVRTVEYVCVLVGKFMQQHLDSFLLLLASKQTISAGL